MYVTCHVANCTCRFRHDYAHAFCAWFQAAAAWHLKKGPIILISNFRRVLNVVCFLLGDSPASEIYMPTFRNTLFHLKRQVGACRMNSAEDMLVCYTGKGLVWKWPEPLDRGRTEWGGRRVRVQKQVVMGPRLTLRPTGGCVKETGRVEVGREW